MRISADAIQKRYHDALRRLPSPGGNGCHQALLGVSNLGVLSGLTDVAILEDIRQAVPAGVRRVDDREISDAIHRARLDHQGLVLAGHAGRPQSRSGPRLACIENGEAIRHRIIRHGRAMASFADVWEASPIRIDWPPAQDAIKLLEHLYTPDDLLFIGTRHAAGRRDIMSAAAWQSLIAERIGAGSKLEDLPHIIPNPLTGRQGETKSGKLSWRADSCVASFRFCVVEFDSISMDDQLAFWAGFRVPVAALIDSGGKSIHAWLRVDAGSREAWETEVEDLLYGRILGPLGVDTACRNEARLSRLPGAFRQASNRWQTLLYLAPEGRPVFP